VGLQLAGHRDGDLALLELAAAAQRLLTGAGEKPLSSEQSRP
jgi:Asp-tRNA(Asn)/Glu-tRNA(Gln) amidotransferase A subunit family amidase